jgi:hypothetical protein
MFEGHLGSERVTLSIADISSPSLFDSSLAMEVTGVTPITAITSRLGSNTSGDSRDPLKQKAPLLKMFPEQEPSLIGSTQI